MKTLIIGASGLIGRALKRAMAARQWEVYGVSRSRPGAGDVAMDITDAETVHACVSSIQPDVICLAVNVPGGVDACEVHPDESHAINVAGIRHVTRAVAERRTCIVLFSSDYVFDGRYGPYAEDHPPSPLQVYGHHKLEAERWVQEHCPRHLILRINAVFGWDRHSQNFANQVWEHLRIGNTMRVPHDQWCTPTLVDDVAECTVRLLEHRARGVVHVTGRDWVSRAALGVRLAEAMGVNAGLIMPVTTAELGQKAIRPLLGGLKADKLKQLLKMEAPRLEDALNRFHSQWALDHR